MKEQPQGKRNPKQGGKPAGKFNAGSKPAAKKPLIQIGRITSAMPTVHFPSRHAEATDPEKKVLEESCPAELPFTVEPETSTSVKLPWRQYLSHRIKKNWHFFILNLIGIISSIIIGRLAFDRLFFLSSGQYPLIHFETSIGELSPKIWFILNIPTTAWFAISVASITSLVSSVVLMVMFWLPNEPEEAVKRQRNWQIYSMFIQIFAIIFLVINLFTSLGID